MTVILVIVGLTTAADGAGLVNVSIIQGVL